MAPMLDKTTTSNFERGAATWTDERVELLKKLSGRKLSASEIAHELGAGITRCAVIGKMKRLGLRSEMTKSEGASRSRSPRVTRSKSAANKDRGATQRIARILRVRSPSHGGGAVIVESVVREEPPPPPDFLGIRLLDLENWHCRFPRGEGTSITFCGQPVISGFSWCSHCLSIVTALPRPRAEPSYFPTGHARA